MSRRSILAAVFILTVPSLLAAQSPLEQTIREVMSKLRGEAGVYIRHLKTGETIAVNADSLFPTASMIKVPILLGVFEKIERGELDYHAEHIYDDTLLYAGADILGSFRDSASITLSKLVMLMIATSDNTASLWLQHLCGTGLFINDWLAQHGFEKTRVNSRTPGRESEREMYGWGQTTPAEMANLLVMIREKRAVSPGADEEMYRVLSNVYWNGEALSRIPPGVNAASKQGAVNRSRSEVVLVNAPSGDYVFCVMTKNQTDTSWSHQNEGYVLLRKISRILWNHFEPGSDWIPSDDGQRWSK
jgi:beta-lactamase class A